MHMNKLPVQKRVQILSLLCEGSSMRSISRVCDVSINTVTKLLEDAGKFCFHFHDERVRRLTCQRVQVDEIWSFNYVKRDNLAKAKAAPVGAGDVWTWTGIDADTKLICSWMVGERDANWAEAFIDDLAGRMANRIQLTSDGLHAYVLPVASAFQMDVHYAMLVKVYGAPKDGRLSASSECIGAKKKAVFGNPDPKHINTSFVERQNLSMRMHMRRFTRLTNAHSKKLNNHRHAISLYFTFYNWTRIHKTLRTTPAMAAGLTDRVWDMAEIVALMDEVAPKPGRPKTYKKPTAA
jgi:IS1 family transposase